jgi:hypothetical protein
MRDLGSIPWRYLSVALTEAGFVPNCVIFRPTDLFSVQSLPRPSCFCTQLCPKVATIFCSSWDERPTTLWTAPAFSESATMTREDLTHPVAAAATSQVKLCPYDEEEPHIWFRLIEAQFAAAGIRSQKLKYANALASLPSPWKCRASSPASSWGSQNNIFHPCFCGQ